MSLNNNTMNIVGKKIKIKEIVKGYDWDTIREDKNVLGYDGKLKIQPEFQRNFCYNEEEQRQLIYSILSDFPTNAIYFYQPEEQKKKGIEYYELLDGQQRIISICNFYKGNVYINTSNAWDKENLVSYSSLSKDMIDKFLNYELDVYICNGKLEDRIDWFKRINIGNKVLMEQEILNSNISPSQWLESAKSYFSKRVNGAAYMYGKEYMKGDVNRQAYLETVLKWYVGFDIDVNKSKVKTISEYMNVNQNKGNAEYLFDFFRNVIDWVKKTFPVYSKIMSGYDWGKLYTNYWKTKPLYSEEEIVNLLNDCYSNKEINQQGIFEFIFTNDERVLQKRSFDDEDKRKKYSEQKGKCFKCLEKFEINEMEGDHFKPLSKGGKTTYDNLKMLCSKCNKKKGANYIEMESK